MDKHGKLPDSTESYWIDSTDVPTFPQLDENISVDAVIVGGGITGITSAYLLANQGRKVALLEADRVLNGTTGHTTAKITAQHDLIYDELITNMGKSKARLYYEANMEALTFIKKTIDKLQIKCDFSEQDAYMYATTEEYKLKIEKEAEAYKTLNIDGELTDTIPLDILEIRNALIMRKQGQFHPLKYLSTLVQQIKEKGGLIFENTTAVNVETGEHTTVLTRDGFRVTAKHVLACSHFPFYEGVGLYSTRMYADRSYVLAAKTKKKLPDGVFISAGKPKRSLRSVTINGEEMVLIVGESHKTGQGIDTMKHYEALEDFGQQVLGLESIEYRWSAQDLTTLDKVPYIGAITSGDSNVLIATGYRKWGMSNGTAAALLLSDIVLGKKNNFEQLFTPTRPQATQSLKNFFVQNANVASHLIKGKLELSNIDPKTLSNDQAAITTVKGERKGAYRDTNGELHIVDTTCTHVGCEVEWNSGDRTWDCPCHGSRFSFTGDVIEGPAEKPLQKYDYKMIDNLTSEDSGY
ncbi:FAD-dependent oxidoreductase [Virgibacillus oceani]|uniref:Oxidoreductase n=1 Tax=Virgibacillus oceani TaxID=1479511 RepID=A0A917HHM8_9BACI|nr:FAD-dependent oxidoreductase [Virgibacillus oceani]GGG78879.1 oxidoreductase [Virgibacillus oceani]